jgi:hypothetical protein
MSGRSTLYDAVVTALGSTSFPSTSTAIRYVTRNIEEWWNWAPDRFPGVRVVDKTEEKKPVGFWGTTDVMDMEGTVDIEVSGYVRDETNTSINAYRSTLISDIERIVMSSPGIRAVCGDIWPLTVETDEGTIENLGTCAVTFRCRYFYNHAGP